LAGSTILLTFFDKKRPKTKGYNFVTFLKGRFFGQYAQKDTFVYV